MLSDMVCGYFTDFPRRIVSDKVLRDKAFTLLKDQNIMDINVEMLHWFINFLIKRLLVVLLHVHGYWT